MKRVLLIYAVLIAGIIIWYYQVGNGDGIFEEAKANANALTVGKHSPEFNRSMEEVMKRYYEMTDEFIKEDTVTIDKTAAKLKTALASLKIEELKKDSAIYETAASIWDNTKTEIAGMIGDASLQAKRESLNLFSSELLTLLLAVHYDLSKLYWQECSSAFGEDTPGNWISAAEKAISPYGKKDCALVKKVIDFMPADPNKK